MVSSGIKYPSIEDYQTIGRFHTKFVLEERDPGYYVARERGILEHFWDARKGHVGIFWNPPTSWYSPKRHDIMPRAVAIDSLEDFGWKLMCAMINRGEL